MNKVGLASLMLLTALSGCGGDDTGPALPGAEALLFVQRFDAPPGGFDVQVVDYTGQRRDTRNGLMVLEPPTPSGTLRNLTASFGAVDINAVDLSFDGTQAVFSMATDADPTFHLYVADLEGASPPRQLTFGEQDDVFPIWVPGDRIAFVTNEHYGPMGRRADEYNHTRNVGQIATVSATLGDADRRRCSQNLSNTSRLFLLSDGRIGYARWEHLGPVNDVKLFAMNPDCTQMVGLAGQHGKPANSLVQVREASPGVFVGIGTTRERTISAGSLLSVDARSTSGLTDILIDEERARFTELTPSVPFGPESPPSGAGRYMTPFPIDGGDGDLLVSWANGDVNDRNELAGTTPNFGIYLWDAETRERTLVFDDPHAWDVYAVIVAPREMPPVHPGTLEPEPDPSTPAVLGSIDVAITSLPETVDGAQFHETALDQALTEARRVRIIEGFSSEIGPVGQFGLTMHEGAAILGETIVHPDGSWEADVPPLLPYHLQPIDRFGLAIRNEMLWIQAMPGESRRCGGCHESRVNAVQPRNGPTTIASNQRDNLNRGVAERIDLAWANATVHAPRTLMPHDTIQDLLDAKCASCHDGGEDDPFAGRNYTVTARTMSGGTETQVIPYLDLSSRPIEAYYEREVIAYPASYVSLMYPSAMMGDSMASGDMAPEWIIPGSARQSRLIEVINVPAEDDPSVLAWSDRPLHPEDQGVTLTREERMMLVRMADLGGQYYSRRNVGDGAQPMDEDYE